MRNSGSPNIILGKGLVEDKPRPTPSPWLGLLQLLITCGVFVAVVYGFIFVMHKTAPKEVEVPEIIGLDRSAAVILLRKGGLEPGKIGAKPSEEFDAGKVIASNPPQGQRVKKGRRVDFSVSAGSSWTQVPDIREMTERRARALLADTELFLGRTRLAYSKLPEGFVVAQIPSPGSKVPTNTPIEAVVSKGRYRPPPEPDPHAAPDDPPAANEGDLGRMSRTY